MSMTIHDFAQGSPEWRQHRATHFNASDAPAMMGCSPYMTRTELLTRLKTGIAPEVDPATQRRFDDGHRFEALARPLAEQIIGQDLYPLTGSRGKLSASFDGLTDGIDGPQIDFEHKTLNDELRNAFDQMPEGGDSRLLPLVYRVQMEQQLIVSGATRALFMASKWSGDTLAEERHCWYVSDPELRAQIVAGWTQFAKDLATFVPAEAEAPAPAGKAPDTLPALRIEVTGMVTTSNLAEFKSTALIAIRGVNRALSTDQDFADAEKSVKWCEEVESRLKAAKEHALSQTASIDELFKAIDDISSEARDVRLELTKLVKARKDAIKAEIVHKGAMALIEHVRALEPSIGYTMPPVPADFAGVVKGLKSVASMRNAVDTELARAKIAANEVGEKIRGNLKAITESGLAVHDTAVLVLKAPDDLAAVLAQRKAAEVARQEAERERIRKEEADRLEREAATKAAAEKFSDPLSFATVVAPESDQFEQLLSDPASETASLYGGKLIKGEIGMVDCAVQIITDTSVRLTLGQINERIAPLSISVAGLYTLGFEPAEQVKSARLYRECDFPAICAAMVKHITEAAQPIAA